MLELLRHIHIWGHGWEGGDDVFRYQSALFARFESLIMCFAAKQESSAKVLRIGIKPGSLVWLSVVEQAVRRESAEELNQENVKMRDLNLELLKRLKGLEGVFDGSGRQMTNVSDEGSNPLSGAWCRSWALPDVLDVLLGFMAGQA